MAFRLVRRAAACAAMLLVLLGAPAAAQVPDPHARELASQLAEAEGVLTRHGFSRVAGPFAGGLAQGRSRTFQVTLRGGQEYRLLGVCDSRCGDLDLKLYDMNGALLAQDVLADRFPIVQIRPRTTGAHSIEVAMYRCAATPCYFAFNVYAR